MIANAPVGRIGAGAASIAHTGAYDAVQTPKLGIRSPESAQAKCASFNVPGEGLVDCWDGHGMSRLTFHATPVVS
jgi:hypothetical protein